MSFLGLLASRLSRPVVSEAKRKLHRFAIAVSLIAAGIGCLIVGMAYLASALWHELAAAMGPTGADIMLGLLYSVAAVSLLAIGSRLLR